MSTKHTTRTSCPLCHTTDFDVLFFRKERRFVRCRHDGLIMVNPLPTPAEIKRIYEEDYFDWQDRSAAACIGYWAYIAEKPLLLQYFGRKAAMLRERYGIRGKVLDVGCGHGFFLEAAKAKGLTPVGIDLSPQAVAYAKGAGLTVYRKDLKGAFPMGSFPALTAFQLIEHVTDPVAFLRDAFTVLKPGGVILLATPKAEGYLHRLMGRHWLSYRHREHLYFFSAATLGAALAAAGFTDITPMADETRTYPVRHLLGGVKYYFKWKIFHRLADWAGKFLGAVGLLDVQVPVPLDTLVMVARKPGAGSTRQRRPSTSRRQDRRRA